MTQTITIQEALRAIKLTEKKMASNMSQTMLIAVQYADRKVVGGAISADLFIEQSKASFQSSNDLIKRYHELKGKVAEKNATTTIKVAGRTMSVSAAIEYKVSLSLERALLKKLQTELALAVREVNSSEQRLRQEAENAAAAFFGATVTEKKSTEDYTSFIDKYIAARAVTIVDPNDATTEIKKLSDFLDEFEAEIDNLLTLSNVNTTIDLD